MPIAPTLILGLGGTGSTIIKKVAEKVDETGTAQSERIAFVAFDTDINDLADLRRHRQRIFTVQTSTRNTVGEYLNTNTYARDVWFPVNALLNRKTLTEGAAQVRAISRLSFETTLKGGQLEPLHTAIDELFRVDKDQEEQALRVIITSSLAGGTGSGLILPLAMYLSDYLRSRYPRAKAITRGFFIQPDIFNLVIPAAEERNNLHVNAYATIRELDAFLMKGDNTLPPEYAGLELEFPRVGADGVHAIHGMPYDFCFLFDANNAGSGSLMNFEAYLDHAATCIYTQSIGPMSKRSNSREDNVLREIIKHNGRNRYAGAGASRLVYPWLHVRDFVAMKWAANALSVQWLQFDERMRDKREARLQQRELGYLVQDLDPGMEFIQLVDSAADAKEPFARAVQKQCLAYDDEGLSVVGDRWSEYVTQLKAYVERNAVVPADEAHRRNAEGSIAELYTSKEPEDYVTAYQEIKKYHDRVERNADESAGVIGYTLFRADSGNVTRDRHEHRLETYLRDKVTGNFVHPVSARYFLYQTLELMKNQKQIAQNELERQIKFFEGFESMVFDDPSTDDVVETAMDFANRKRSLRDRLRRGPGGDLQEVTTNFSA